MPPMHPFLYLKIHFNIIFPSTPRSSNWSLSLKFPHQPPPFVLHSLSISFFLIKDHVVMSTSPVPCYLVFLRHKYLPENPILIHPQPTFFSQYQIQSFTPIQSNRLNRTEDMNNNYSDQLYG